MVNYERWFGRLLYRQLEGQAAVERLGLPLSEGREPRGVRDKTKSSIRAAKRGNTWGFALTCQQGSR